jgi:hypothetical protein
MSEQSRSKGAGYRQRARSAREAARWISLKDARAQLLETAQNLDLLAEEEERREAALKPRVRSLKPKA